MSIPLPTFAPKGSRLASLKFLDEEERYEVYNVKTAERPHLLAQGETDDSLEENDVDPPLIDGCDIPGWRCEKIVVVSEALKGVLNIGSSSTMFRRERQWSSLPSSSAEWTAIREMLGGGCSELRPPSIESRDASKLVTLEDGRTVTHFASSWERQNRPVVVTGCASAWQALPRAQPASTGWT